MRFSPYPWGKLAEPARALRAAKPWPSGNLPRPTPPKSVDFSNRCAANGHITFNLAQPSGINGHFSDCAEEYWAVHRPNPFRVDRKKGVHPPFLRASTSHTIVVPPFCL